MIYPQHVGCRRDILTLIGNIETLLSYDRVQIREDQVLGTYTYNLYLQYLYSLCGEILSHR